MCSSSIFGVWKAWLLEEQATHGACGSSDVLGLQQGTCTHMHQTPTCMHHLLTVLNVLFHISPQAKSSGWSVTGNVVVLPRNPFNTAVQKRTQETVRFDAVAPVLRASA